MLFDCYLQPHRRITIYRKNLTRLAALQLYEVFVVKDRGSEVKFRDVDTGIFYTGEKFKYTSFPVPVTEKFTKKKRYHDESKSSGHRFKFDNASASRVKVPESSDREVRVPADDTVGQTDNSKSSSKRDS